MLPLQKETLSDKERWQHLADLADFALAMKVTLMNINYQSFNNFMLRIGKSGRVGQGLPWCPPSLLPRQQGEAVVVQQLKAVGPGGTLHCPEPSRGTHSPADQDVPSVSPGTEVTSTPCLAQA